jgi:hypothetical protein
MKKTFKIIARNSAVDACRPRYCHQTMEEDCRAWHAAAACSIVRLQATAAHTHAAQHGKVAVFLRLKAASPNTQTFLGDPQEVESDGLKDQETEDDSDESG